MITTIKIKNESKHLIDDIYTRDKCLNISLNNVSYCQILSMLTEFDLLAERIANDVDEYDNKEEKILIFRKFSEALTAIRDEDNRIELNMLTQIPQIEVTIPYSKRNLSTSTAK